MHARRRPAIKPASREGDRSRFIVEGDVDAAEWLRAYEGFVQAEPDGHVLWDLTEGSLNILSAADVRELARSVCAIRDREHASGRFALVCRRDVDFGIARMLVIYAGCADARAPMQVFRDADLAWRWLSGADVLECLRGDVRTSKRNDPRLPTPDAGSPRLGASSLPPSA